MRRPPAPWLLLAIPAALLSAVLFLNSSRAPRAPLSAAPTPAPAFVPASPPAPAPVVAPPLPASGSDVTFAENSADSVSAPLLAWFERFRATPDASARAALLPEGLALARERRPLLAALIRTDPAAALSAAIPRTVRAALPSEIVAELEQLVSARAELALIQTCLHPPGAAHDPADDLHRATVIDDREYRVHVYGSRLRDASLPATSLIGIAIDRDLAVSDARLRLLSPEEAELVGAATAAGPTATVAVEANGSFTVLPSPDALPAFAARLLASEENPVVLAADAGAGSSTVTGRPTQAWTHGDKDLLVIRVDFSDLPGEPINKFDGNAAITAAYIDNVINGANGVRAFLHQSSYAKTDLAFDSAADLTAVLRLPDTAANYATAGDNTRLHTDARAAAVSAGFPVDAYHRVAVVFSYLGDLSGSKITYGGLANITGSNLWVNGAFDLRVVGHELGHTYGLHHANLWRPASSDPVSLAGDNLATPDIDERSVEYGDPFDLMGDGDFFENDFSHWNKSLLQWIPDTAVTVAESGGTYRIHRFDSSAADLSAPRALKIVRDTTRDYWIGYRRGTSSTHADNGAYVLWGYNSNTQGDLLDLASPGTNASDAPLPLGATFNDSAAGITLRPVAQGGSGAGEWLDLQLTMLPRIQWTATSYVADEQGGSVVLTATRTANSTGNVSVSYVTAPGSAASTADFTFASGTLSWTDGDTAPKTVTVPLVADALAEGTETFTVTLHSPTGGVIVDPAEATVTIADPGARDPSFAADFINSNINRILPLPDGKILVAGFFSQLQDSDFTVYDFGHVARLTATGAIDPEFNPGSGADGTIYALARQPDGKILIGGSFTTFSGTTRTRLARLNTDGSLDTTFDPGAGADGTVYAILVQPDGKILLGGSFTTVQGAAREYLARLLPDGSLDSGFVGPDFGATTSWSVRSLALQADGRLVVGGQFYLFASGNYRFSLCRVTASGELDSTFDGVTAGAHAQGNTTSPRTVLATVVQPDGKILIGGNFTAYNNTTRYGLARVEANGALDSTFTPGFSGSLGTYTAMSYQPDGRILAGGDLKADTGGPANPIRRFLTTGAIDSTFLMTGASGSTIADLALQPDGLLLFGGGFSYFAGGTTLQRPLWRLIPGLSSRPGVLQFSADAAPGIEGGNATLGVTRSGGSLGALTVGYSTVAGTATAGVDYTTSSGTLSWADGDSSTKTITVPLAADSLADTPETFLVNLGAPLIGGALLAERQQATVTLATAFSAWQSARFTAAELADATVSGDAADPDADGPDNLAEFALAREPRVADAASAWTTAVQNIDGADYLTISFRRRAPALDLAYAVQSNADLANNSWIADAVQVGSALDHGDGTETVTFRDSVSVGSAARRFLRVHVTRTP